MKIRKLPAAIALVATVSTSLSPQAFAARSESQQAWLEGGTVSTAAIAGAAAGGPVGFMVGGVVGMLLADQTRKGNNAEIALEASQNTMNQLNQELTQLSRAVEDKAITIAALEQKTVDKLALQVLFNTGEDTLSEQDLARVEVLAQHLRANDDLIVNLSGHTDPRGTDEYNNVLAIERANTVKAALTSFGVDDSRIITHGLGASLSTAQQGQYEQYARDRRVDIEVINRNLAEPVAIIESESR